MAGVYCGTAEVKTWLSITGSGDDLIIDKCCEAAEALIEKKIGVPVVAASDTREYDAVGDHVRANGRDLVIDYHTTLTTVTNGDGVNVTSFVTRLPNNAAYKNRLHLSASSGRVWTYTSDPVAAITVLGNFGLVAAAANVPGDIERLAWELAGWLYRTRDTSMGAEILAQTRAGSLLMPSNMPPHIQSMLNRLGSIFA
jgi:hypothetical protein